MKNNILILNTYYLPGFKGGGPVKSIKNIVSNLDSKFNFYIITSDRDLNDDYPYSDIEVNQWIQKDGYKICYINTKKIGFKMYRDLINSVNFTHIYLNGFFSPHFTIKPLILKKLGLLKCNSFIISPRGDFSPGHLKIKWLKKNSYILLAKCLSLYTGSGITWQSTSEIETQHIISLYKNANIKLASNLPYEREVKNININKIKEKGKLKLAFISRIVTKKNLLFALECLKEIQGSEIEFYIYGPKEDMVYWEKCESIIKEINNNNIKVRYMGEIIQEDVIKELSAYHGFLFPTFGENYGHVIVEAMLAGCVPIISDQTPWLNLYSNKVGWDLSLADKKGFLNAIKELLEMDQKTFNEYSSNSYKFIIEKSNFEAILKQTEELFL